jgi:PHD/YefM family antitoxin component YafN of YafNO toxin-antitoxin module
MGPSVLVFALARRAEPCYTGGILAGGKAMRQVIAQTLVTHEVHNLDDLFRLLAESDRPIYVSGQNVQAVLLPYETYQDLQARLEDLEDRLAMQEAETKYRAGNAHPFDDILAEIEAEESAHVSD